MEPKTTYADVFPAMVVGKKIRRKNWTENFYIYIPVHSGGVVTDSYGSEYKVPRWEMLLTDWEIVEEPKIEENTTPELTAKDVEIFYTKGKIAAIQALRERYGKKADGLTKKVGLKDAKDLFDVLPPARVDARNYRGLSESEWARIPVYGFRESDINADTMYAVETGPLLSAYLAYAHNNNKG